MAPERIKRELTALAIISILTVFFFPSAQGPFSVVQGPVTAFQAARAAARFMTAIVYGAHSTEVHFSAPLLIAGWLTLATLEPGWDQVTKGSAALRC